MATLRKLKSGNWRVQVRRKGSYLGQTFRRYKDAEEWALEMERRIDRGETPKGRARVDPTTFAHLIDLHVDDMTEVGRAPRRSKAANLPDWRIHIGEGEIGPEVGAGWNRTGEKAGAYVSVILDCPGLVQPIRANLFRSGDHDGAHHLLWSRAFRRDDRS